MAETLTYGFQRQDHVDVRVARIFNTYGNAPFPISKRNPIIYPICRSPQYVKMLACMFFCLFEPHFPNLVNPADGRVVSNFIVQALRGEDMTVYGDGTQTRSFQYIHDLVDGLIALMNSDESRPVNIGNGDEFTIGDFAKLVREIVEKVQDEDGVKRTRRVDIVYKPIPTDDPQKRRPDTTRAKTSLGWEPRWTVRMGLEEMVRYYKAKMAEGSI